MVANIHIFLTWMLNGKGLMPTHPAIARKLLKRKEAIVKTLLSSTLQLTHQTRSYT